MIACQHWENQGCYCQGWHLRPGLSNCSGKGEAVEAGSSARRPIPRGSSEHRMNQAFNLREKLILWMGQGLLQDFSLQFIILNIRCSSKTESVQSLCAEAEAVPTAQQTPPQKTTTYFSVLSDSIVWGGNTKVSLLKDGDLEFSRKEK